MFQLQSVEELEKTATSVTDGSMVSPSDNYRVALDRFTSLSRQLVQHMDLMVKMGYIPLAKYPVRFGRYLMFKILMSYFLYSLFRFRISFRITMKVLSF